MGLSTSGFLHTVGDSSPPGDFLKSLAMTESVGPAPAEGAQLSRCLPGKCFVIQDLCQPSVKRPIEVPQNLLGDRPHGPQAPILRPPCVGRRALSHQSFLLLA